MRRCEEQFGQPVMILRHDVDVSLDLALKMAEVENNLGVRSTYFILLYNEFYNPLSPNERKRVRDLTDMGHEIGLHWDSSLYPSDEASLDASFRRDLDILGDVAGHEILSASQHVPIDNPYLDVTKLIKYEAYSKPVTDRYTYVSDSSMTWRQNTPLDLVNQKVDVQFLAHPVWWASPGETLEDKLSSLGPELTNRSENILQEYIDYTLECLAKREELDRNFKNRASNTLRICEPSCRRKITANQFSTANSNI